ncbi:MAG: isochorismatase family protein [Bacilli bacterium]|nr:isochorismatase family protein [Bacilli bacterium]
MRKVLIVIDMQVDFLTGSLANKEGVAAIDPVIKEINDFQGEVYATLDTHGEDYMSSNEGHYLPVVHCVKGTPGHQEEPRVAQALSNHPGFKGYIEKPTFGYLGWKEVLGEEVGEIELIGVCTDICVLSNAAILKASYPNAKITCKASCCAGVAPELHEAALKVLSSIQVEVL